MKQNLEIQKSVNDHILCIEIKGSYVRRDINDFIGFMIAEATKSKCESILIDARQLSGFVPDLDRYELGIYLADQWEKPLKLAVVYRKDEINHFFETVASNRGIQVRVLSSNSAAKRWLKAETTS